MIDQTCLFWYFLNMIQLYFLSILCNGLSGFILFAGKEEESVEGNALFSINNPMFHLVLGILSAVTGVLKLLSPTMDGIPILGDLIPAAAGVTAGLLLIFGMYRQSTASPESKGELDRIGFNLLRFRKTFGLGLMIVALIHFLFPQALFL
jgi:hypothetical protein